MTKQGVAQRDVIMKARKKIKPPIRLNARPTRPHSTKKGMRGYHRRRFKAQLRAELKQTE